MNMTVVGAVIFAIGIAVLISFLWFTFVKAPKKGYVKVWHAVLFAVIGGGMTGVGMSIIAIH